MIKVNVKMLESIDSENYDAVLIHGYDANNKTSKKNTYSKLLQQSGLLTTYREISLISKQRLNYFAKSVIEKNIDAILVKCSVVKSGKEILTYLYSSGWILKNLLINSKK